MNFGESSLINIDYQQQLVLLSLICEAQSRKEISDLLSEYTQTTVNEIKVKNLLSASHEKFESSTFTQLIQMVVKNKFKIDLSGTITLENHLQQKLIPFLRAKFYLKIKPPQDSN